MEKDLVPVDVVALPQDTSDVVGQTIKASLEGLTGLLTSDRKDFIRSVGFILQRCRSIGFLDAFKAEWNRYREEGRVNDDYLKTEQHAECLQELLDFLDQESPDQKRFDALKKILLVSATGKHSSRESVLPQQYMKLVRKLGSRELLVVLTTYSLAKNGNWSKDEDINLWAKEIAEASGLRFPELVLSTEKMLIDSHLIRDHYPGASHKSLRPPYNRLTDLGYQLCEFISNYSETE